MTEITELPTAKPDLADWRKAILERDAGRCVNCESSHNCTVAFIVPPEAGGRIRPANGITICRDCKQASESYRILPSKIDNKTPINFLISKRLHALVEDHVQKTHFGSISTLIRYMVSSFISNPDMFEDLQQYQDDGSDIKVNLWAPSAQYELFKQLCWERGMSFTDAFKALLLVAVNNQLSGDKS